MHRSGTCVRRNNSAAPGASLCRRDDAVITGLMSRVAAPILSVALAAFVQMALVPGALAGAHDALIARHAAANGVPEQLVRRIIRIESRGNAGAVHAGNYGLMQIRLGTARGVGYSGNAEGLLDPDTNLTYAVKYLAGAYRAAGCDADRAVSYYQRGYYGAALRECAESPLTRIAEAEPKTAAAKLKRDTAKSDAVAAKPADVIKPKVVRTETIATPKSGSALAQPVGNFEPKRVAPPPAAIAKTEPVAAKPAEPKAEPRADPKPGHTQLAEPKLPEPKLAEPKQAEPKLAAPAPVAAEPAAKFELASVPMPPARPEFEPAPKREVQPTRRPARVHERTDKKPSAEAKAKSDPKADSSGPARVVSFLKKLVTPAKTARKRSVEAEADPPSQVQPPQ